MRMVITKNVMSHLLFLQDKKKKHTYYVLWAFFVLSVLHFYQRMVYLEFYSRMVIIRNCMCNIYSTLTRAHNKCFFLHEIRVNMCTWGEFI